MELELLFSNNRILNKHGTKILWAVAGALLALTITWIVVTEISDRKDQKLGYAPQKLRPIQSKTAPQYQVSQITAANLFGDPTPKVEVVKNIPSTKLNLKLVGVLWDSDQTSARAIIQSGSRQPKLYSPGQKIDGAGASVKEIHSTEILISRNGATEKLLMEKNQGLGDDSILSYEEFESSPDYLPELHDTNLELSKNRAKPISPNGENRKIKKPNFSGLDRALQKLEKI